MVWEYSGRSMAAEICLHFPVPIVCSIPVLSIIWWHLYSVNDQALWEEATAFPSHFKRPSIYSMLFSSLLELQNLCFASKIVWNLPFSIHSTFISTFYMDILCECHLYHDKNESVLVRPKGLWEDFRQVGKIRLVLYFLILKFKNSISLLILSSATSTSY